MGLLEAFGLADRPPAPRASRSFASAFFSGTVAERDRKRGNANVCVDSFKAIML